MRRFQIHVSHGVIGAEHDARNLGRAQGTGNEQLRIGRPVDDIDVLVTQFANDAMDT